MCKALHMPTAVPLQPQFSRHPDFIHTPAYPGFITVPGHVRKNGSILYLEIQTDS